MIGPVGVFRPGDSPLHRAPTGAKLLGLAMSASVLALATGPWWLASGTVLTVMLYAVAGVGPATARAQVWPLRWFLLVLLVVQTAIAGPLAAITVTGRIVLVVGLAGLVTLTTGPGDLVAALERALSPLRVVGVDPERVALVLSLAVRSVAVIDQVVRQVREARLARNRERSLRAFAVPVVTGVLSHANRLGEALRARGLDD